MREEGIRDLSGIMQRCHIDADSGCWLWRGGMNSSNVPLCSIPAGVLAPGRKVMSSRRAAWLLSGGKVGSGQVVHLRVSCTDERCVSPMHAKLGPPGAQVTADSKRHPGKYCSPERLSPLRKQHSMIATPKAIVAQVVQSLAAGAAPGQCAALFGIHRSTAVSIARGNHMHQRQGLMRGASVFAWGGGA